MAYSAISYQSEDSRSEFVIEKYSEALFYRGMSPGKSISELRNFASAKLTFGEATRHVEEDLKRKDYVFDPVTPSYRRVDDGGFLELRLQVLKDLSDEGLLDLKSQISSTKLNQEQERRFDRVVMKSLFHQLKMTLYESSKVEVWSYFTSRVLPDLAILRFPLGDKTDSQLKTRLSGSDRNVFRRLHHRSVLTAGDFSLLESLKEDNLVAIFERPRLTQDPEFVVNLLGVISRCVVAELPNSSREDAVRDFAKRILRACASTRVEYFDSEDSIEIMEELAKKTVASFLH